MQPDIGTVLKRLRKEKGMTLKQISEKTGLSISFISQVERLKSSITIESLTKISDALEVSPTYFFQENDKTNSFLHRSNSQNTKFMQSNFIYQGLSAGFSNPIFEPMLVTLLPNNQKISPFTHNGQEFLYVLEGTLTVLLDYEEYELYPGDSFHVESSRPHNWFNKSNETVKMLYICSRPFGDSK